MTASLAQKQVPRSGPPSLESLGKATPSAAYDSDRAFQLREMLPLAVFAGLLLLLAAVLVFIPMHRDIAADPNPAIQALLGSFLLRLELWLVPLLALSAAAGSMVAVVRARRIARPVRQVREALAQLGIGPVAPFTVRKGDEFADLEPAFTSALNRVEQLNRGRSELLRFLRRNLDGLVQRAASQQLTQEQLQESLAAMLRDVDTEIQKLPKE